MDNPLSRLLAEIFIVETGSKIHRSQLSTKFRNFYEFVDDIIACFVGADKQVAIFENRLNF